MKNSDSGRDDDFSRKFYWAVDIPGLSEEQAENLIAHSSGRHGIHGMVIDPKDWLTLHLDRETAEVLRDALSPVSNDISVGLREIVEEWLDSKPSPKSEE